MMKKIACLFVAAACLAGAQDYETVDALDAEPVSTEAAPAPVQTSTPAQTPAPSPEEKEHSFYIGVHPLSLIILTAVGAPMVYVTVEKPLFSTGSFMAKPGVLYMGESYFKDHVYSTNNFTATYFGLEVAAGYRQYFSQLHRGAYFEVDFAFAHAGLDAQDYYHNGSLSGNIFGLYSLIGWKSRPRPVIMSFDIGFSYARVINMTASGDIDEKRLKEASKEGFSITGNYAVSLGF